MPEQTDKQKQKEREAAAAKQAEADRQAQQGNPAANGEAANAPKGRLVKYMGTADVKVLNRGYDHEGTLPPLPEPLRFTRNNGWTIDTGKRPEISDAWWTTLLESPDFQDVTDFERKPLNAHQRTFLGMAGEPIVSPALDAQYAAEGQPVAGGGDLTDRPAPTTTVGGSTPGA